MDCINHFIVSLNGEGKWMMNARDEMMELLMMMDEELSERGEVKGSEWI